MIISIKKLLFLITFSMLMTCLCSCNLLNSPSDGAKTLRTSVIEIEKYGHAVLDITAEELANSGYDHGDIVKISFESHEFEMPYYSGYYSNPGEMMLRGDDPDDRIAVCINFGDFSGQTGLNVGDTVNISRVEKAGMLEIETVFALRYSDDRGVYPDDATFTNFREVTLGVIEKNKLYRSASPINNEHNRAHYSGKFLEDIGAATVLNLSENNKDIEEFLANEELDTEYYRNLYESGKVMALDLGNNFFTHEFIATIADGLTFLASNEAPYFIHCVEGKDRTGFVLMMIEAVMGAELDDIVNDYMLSFSNYYGIYKEEDPEKYNTVLEKNLYAMLYHITGADNYEELAEADLKTAAIEYLIGAGMTEEDIAALQEKLRD